MGRLKPGFIALLLLLSLNTHPALAIPIVAVDVDPVTPDVQSTLTVLVGSAFDVDIVIQDVVDLQAFQLDLDFPSLLGATSVVSGGFLVPPTFTLPPDLTSPDVNFAETNLGTSGASGSGVLASVSFDALAAGTGALSLNDVILSEPFAIPIAPFELNDGSVTVEALQALPEPNALLLLGAGLLAAIRLCRGRG